MARQRKPARVLPPDDGHLFQERLLDEPFWMLVACSLVNLTNWNVARGAFEALRASYVDPKGLSAAAEDDLQEVLRPLGLWRRRATSLVRLARAWSERPPATSADVMRLPGCGAYAADSWAIFMERRTDVQPKDGKLVWYLSELERRHERSLQDGEAVQRGAAGLPDPAASDPADRGAVR